MRGWPYCPGRDECEEDRELARLWRQAEARYPEFPALVQSIIKNMGKKRRLTVVNGGRDDRKG